MNDTAKLFSALLGVVDENEQYYTEAMFERETGAFVIALLLTKKLVTQEEVTAFKKQWMETRNKQLIAELKGKPRPNKERED